MGGVNQARLDVSKAKDTLAEENLSHEKANRYIAVAKDEVAIAKAQIDRNESAQKAADYARNDQATSQSQSAMGLARQREQVANSHVNAATELERVQRGTRERRAEGGVDLANARLEQAEFKAVQATGDPVVNNIDGQAIAKRAEDARVALEQQRAIVSQTKASASAARSRLRWLRDQLPADQRFGVGRLRLRTLPRT